MKPWEKYQQQAQGKPWEKYAKTQEQPKPQTEEPSFLVGLGKGFADTERGLTNLVGYDRYGDTSEADKQIKDSVVGMAGSMVGSVLSAVPTAFIPGANTVTGGALIGGATGALFNKDNRLQNAGLGFAGGGLGNALPYVANLAHKVVAPFGGTATKEKILSKLLNEVAGDNAPAIQGKLAGAAELVPGSAPTAAEVAESGGISALQRYSAQANPEAYSHRAQTQAAARIEALQGIAKDEQALQAAIAERGAVTSPLYKESDKAIAQGDDELLSIMARLPKGTMETAKDIARMEAKPIEFGRYAPEQVVQKGVSYATGKPIEQVLPAEYGEISGRGIDLLKKSIDKLLEPDAKNSITKAAQGAEQGVKTALTKWADDKIPAYAKARSTYQDLSQPINQMQVGQELLSKMRPALADYGALGRETGNRYATALNDIRGNLVKQATGGIKRNLEDVMTPEQMQTLNAVGQDLARKANAQDLGREFGSGSNTFQNLAMNGIAEAAGIPSALSGALQFMKPGLNGAAKLIYSSPEQKMRQMLADALLEPQETARIMDIVNNPSVLAKLLRNKQVGALPGVLGSSIAESSQQ
jgi:hypothetical protein